MIGQAEKGDAFRALHARDQAFIIPNPWDVGGARLLASAGFEALATTSAGFAFSMGRRDNAVTRREMMAHLAAIAAATDLPVSADLENGFAHAPGEVAETIRLAAGAGVVGGSIEDATGRADDPIYALEFACERIRAAAEAARALLFAFTLTARAENYLFGRPNLGDTIRRLQAYQDAGADVLYAPGLTDLDEIAALVREVDRPVNVLAGVRGLRADRAALCAVGVKRISVGSALARRAYGALLQAADEMQEDGVFTFAEAAIGHQALSDRFPIDGDSRSNDVAAPGLTVDRPRPPRRRSARSPAVRPG
jgi:2-methylisocitrate lyase-like PEP mutase family enzyme